MADRRLELAGLLAITVAGATVWLAHHPEHPALECAARWPWVGGAVAGFRQRFAPPAPRPVPAAAQSASVVLELRLPEPPGTQDSPIPLVPPAGVRRSPSLPSPAVDRTPIPVGPLPALAAEPSRLANVRRLLGPAAHSGELGPYRLLTDVEPPPRWSELAAALDAAYAERTGRVPIGAPAETVALFAERAAYRRLQQLEPQLAGLDPDGHAGYGIAALTLEVETGTVPEATLVHELVHFLNRRALGPALPPWLEEGLAEELAWTRFDTLRGGFQWGELRPGLHRQGARLSLSGAVAGIDRLADDLAHDRLPTIVELVDLEWSEFVGAGAERRYAHARLLVAFLLDDRRWGPAFRTFLADVAAGGEVGREALEAALGIDLEHLELPLRVELAALKAREVDAGVRALTAPGETVRPRPRRDGQPPAGGSPEPSGSSSRQVDEPSA